MPFGEIAVGVESHIYSAGNSRLETITRKMSEGEASDDDELPSNNMGEQGQVEQHGRLGGQHHQPN